MQNVAELTSTGSRIVRDLVSEQARAAPDALAASDGRRTLSYGELDRRAAAVAAALRAEGIGPDVRVALLLERSLELLVAFLGVWGAGGAPVLLDPAWPEERVRRSLELAGSALLLTSEDVAAVGAADGRAEPAPVHLDHLAYVVSTSGSTGTPKPVGVTHRSVSHCVATHVPGHRIVPSDRSSWLAPPGSSASVGELWPYLASGASVHVAPSDLAASPVELQAWLLEAAITKAFVGMPLAEQLYRLPWPAGTPLELMTVGGDQVRVWAEADLPFEVAVSYGSAEANGVCSCLVPWDDRCTSATATASERAARPPVGRAWPDVSLHVLDETLSPVEPGALGELCVASPELARGYLDDAALTAAKLVPDPFAEEPGSRLYRTGDLVGIRPDGLVEHHGRLDAQVKILGNRVELAEVEAALLAHPAVGAVAAAARPDPRGETRIVAYVVGRDQVTVPELREVAARQLPAYALPQAYVFPDELPLNANGKVDRATLPDPDWSVVRVGPPVPPRDEVERELLEIWSQELGVEEVGVEDNFFYFGGDSLSASSLIGRVHERFGLRLRLRDLLRGPTPEALAARIRAHLET